MQMGLLVVAMGQEGVDGVVTIVVVQLVVHWVETGVWEVKVD